MKSKFERIQEGDYEELESPDFRVAMKFAYVKGSSNCVFHGVTVVDAEIEEIAAWETSKMSRENIRERHKENCLECKFRRANNHHFIYQVAYDLMPGVVDPREWVSTLIWKRTSPDSLSMTYSVCKDEEH